MRFEEARSHHKASLTLLYGDRSRNVACRAFYAALVARMDKHSVFVGFVHDLERAAFLQFGASYDG